MDSLDSPKLARRAPPKRNQKLPWPAAIPPIPIDAPKLPPIAALRTIARVGRFVRPYRRQVVVRRDRADLRGGRRARHRPGAQVRHRPRLRRGQRRRARPHARAHARGRRRDGDRDLRAVLLRVLARRARDGRSSPRGVRPPAVAAARLLRAHAHRRSHLAPDQRHDHARDGHRLERVDGHTQRPAHGRRPRDARAHEREAHAARPGGRAAGAGADPVLRPARAQARAREPGPRRRRRRVRRRSAARDPHGAGVRSRGRGSTAVRRARRRRVRHGAAAHSPARVARRHRDRAGVRRGRRHPVDRRPRRGRGTHQRRAAVGVRVLRGHRGERGGHDQRSDRRPAARRGRDRASVRAAGDRARDSRARASGAVAVARARHGDASTT